MCFQPIPASEGIVQVDHPFCPLGAILPNTPFAILVRTSDLDFSIYIVKTGGSFSVTVNGDGFRDGNFQNISEPFVCLCGLEECMFCSVRGNRLHTEILEGTFVYFPISTLRRNEQEGLSVLVGEAAIQEWLSIKEEWFPEEVRAFLQG